MKKYLLILILLLNFELLTFSKNSSDTLSFHYYPLAIGNTWIYHYTESYSGGGTSYDYKITIIDTMRINSILYFMFVKSYPYSVKFLRIDTANGNLLQYSTNNGCSWLINEYLVDSLATKKNNISWGGCEYNLCNDTTPLFIFGNTRNQKTINNSSITSITRKYVYDIGMVQHNVLVLGHYSASYISTLKGCKINNNVYGDTNLTALNELSNNISLQFYLYQNYPNPFNPVTKIKFQLSKQSKTEITIYDITGRKVQKLLNDELNAGVYETDWNAAGLASGIYFCTLTIITGNEVFTDTKKMILLK